MPIVFQQKKVDGSQMAVWRIDESETGLIDSIPFKEELTATLTRITCSSRRLEWLASRLLLYQMAQCHPLVEYSKTGQPFVAGFEHNISISHTRGFAAVCISPRPTAGIDIEYPSDRISRLESRFVNAREAAFIPAGQASVYHGLIWCAKEALYKTAGIPGLIFKDDMLVSPFEAHKEGLISAKLFSNTEVKEYQLLYKVEPDYYLVWHY